ncbi:oxygenase MpaB family protein [Mycolicibacterium mengxianglii]|uniref:oxygenase MpaB family protein n=1 Tax=Mycolicibacterium mengxianglii TaxID=2736649 RepID=UPI0018D1E565|nr:oxygenase MpaB family protein [Mycolicibacterium mengxianglii]
MQLFPPLPHQMLHERFLRFYDDEIRRRYFRGLDFSEPAGDPGWFGPGSAVWHVHSHMPALVLGLQCAAYLERFDPSIYWMGVHHSRLPERDEEGNATGRIDPEGAAVRLGHSLSFFIGTAYGSTPTAERLATTVRAMHHTVKGTRPDGLAYDADDPAWLRWNYATVVWGIATAHEYYHPTPLRGKNIDRYYREFVKVGHALGGTDLPETKAETLECLRSYLPKLGITYGMAMSTGPNLSGADFGPPGVELIDWAIRDTLPKWAAAMVMHRAPNPVERLARQAAVWTVVNGIHTAMGPLPEFRAAKKRVKGAVDAPTSPTYVLGSDPVRSRASVEQMA